MEEKQESESLALISTAYDSSDTDSESQSLASGFCERQTKTFSVINSESSDSDGDDTEKSDSDLESIISNKPSFIPKQIRVKGELSLRDLPPIEDLKISVKEEECIPFGKVYSIVDSLLVVQSLPEKPALNLDSVFFRHNGVPIGQIFDVFGPVKRPFYSVRFNSNKEIHDKGLTVDMVLYAAPETDHTQYVFAKQLMKAKGSDASWVNDTEPPVECLDFSDDEQERNTRKQKKPLVKQEVTEEGSPARKKYLSFEERMNRNNSMRNNYYCKMRNGSSSINAWDVGWHNRIDSPLQLPSSSHNPTSSSPNFGIFQMRPPLFTPPLPTARSIHPRFSQQKYSASPTYNPYYPPPGWPNSSFASPPVHPPIPNIASPPPPSLFYQYHHPPPPPLPAIINPPFQSSSAGSNGFFQFPPQFSSTTNSL